MQLPQLLEILDYLDPETKALTLLDMFLEAIKEITTLTL